MLRTLRRSRACLALLFLAVGASSLDAQKGVASAFGNELRIHTTLRGGLRSVDHDFFEEQSYIGLEVDGYLEDSWFGYELGVTVANEDQTVGTRSEDGDFSEGYLGLRKTWTVSGMHPFLSVGGSYTKLKRNISNVFGSTSEEDWGGGGYVRAGLYGAVATTDFDGGTDITVGADVRAVFVEDLSWIGFGVTVGFGR